MPNKLNQTNQETKVDPKRLKELEMMLKFLVYDSSVGWQTIKTNDIHTLAEDFSKFMFKTFKPNIIEMLINSTIAYNELNKATDEINLDSGEFYSLLKDKKIKVMEFNDIELRPEIKVKTIIVLNEVDSQAKIPKVVELMNKSNCNLYSVKLADKNKQVVIMTE